MLILSIQVKDTETDYSVSTHESAGCSYDLNTKFHVFCIGTSFEVNASLMHTVSSIHPNSERIPIELSIDNAPQNAK